MSVHVAVVCINTDTMEPRYFDYVRKENGLGATYTAVATPHN